MADAGAPEGVIRRAVVNRQWAVDYDYSKLYQEDTMNPWVRTLVGGTDYEVNNPSAVFDGDTGEQDACDSCAGIEHC